MNQIVTPEKSASADLDKMRDENLISVVVLSSGDIDVDQAEIRKLSDWLADGFTFYELILATDHPVPGWRNAMRSIGQYIPRLRVMLLPARDSFDASALSVLEHAIGDYVVLTTPGEVSERDLELILSHLSDGQVDVVRALFDPSKRGVLERLVGGLARLILRTATGQRFLPFPARAVALSRAAIARISMTGGYTRFFRLLEMREYFAEKAILVDGGTRRLWSMLPSKLRVTGEVFSTSALRMVRLLALFCFGLATLSLAAAIGAFAIWLFKSDIAPGWTSLSMLLSILFGSNFAVLGAICLGLVRIIHQATPSFDGQRADEISGGDLFDPDYRLNVRGTDDDPALQMSMGRSTL